MRRARSAGPPPVAKRRHAVLLAAALLVVSLPAPAAAQPGPPAGPDPDLHGRDLDYLFANGLVGGLTAGVTSRLRGGPFLSPFLQGMLGGGVSYAGKRLSASAFDGAGLVGRQIAAVGGSMVRSAAYGGGMPDTLILPVGPGRLHVPLGGRGGPGYRVDLEEVVRLTYGLTQNHLSLDAGASLSAGAFVFVTDGPLRGEHDNALGRASPGTISIRRQGPGLDGPTLAHERAHVAQLDYLRAVWGLPLEGWVRRKLGQPPGSWLERVELGVGYAPMLWLLTAPWPDHASRPLEREAEHLEAVRRGRPVRPVLWGS